MKELLNFQLRFGQTPIDEVALDLFSRDQMPKFLRGVQEIYKNKQYRNEILDIIIADIRSNTLEKDKNKGAPSEFTAWSLFVLTNLLQNGSYDYDQIAELASNHIPLRQIMGFEICATKAIAKSTLHDNLKLVKAETIQKINALVVKFGHSILNPKNKGLEIVADTFVYESNIHFHTDYGSINDGVRCLLRYASRLADILELGGFRKKNDIEKKVKQYCHEIGKINKSNRADKEQAKQATFIKIRDLMFNVFEKCIAMLVASEKFSGTESENRKVKKLRENIQKYLKVICYESGLATRRILLGETIEASEKIFSIFEAHAEMICKGKLKAPAEYGHRVLVMQDQFGLVVKCERTEMGQVDEKIIIGHVDDLKTKCPNLRSLSLDKGFWSPNNYEVLATKVEVLVMPKKGKQTKYEDQPPEYQKLKHKHSRVESCINALESGNNLHICMGKGLESFDMAIACAGVARNLHVIGHHLQQKEKNKLLLKQKLSLCG